MLRSGGIELDPATKRVSCDGAAVELTARERSLLEYLLRRSGDVVSKRDVLDHVWDEAFEGDPNIVEVYVRRLRTKLGRSAIETVRGSGYRLSC